jgi:hypothetical protein
VGAGVGAAKCKKLIYLPIDIIHINTMSSDMSHNSKAAKEGVLMEKNITSAVNSNDNLRKILSKYIGCSIISAEHIGHLNKATDIIYRNNDNKKENTQVKSAKNTSYNGQCHRCDWSNLPTDEAAKKLVKTHCLEGNVDTTQKLTNEQITGLITELCYGTDADYKPAYMIIVFNRFKSDEEWYICSMDRLVDYFISHISSEPMQIGKKHGVVCLSENKKWKLLGLQRKSGDGKEKKKDGTPKGRPNDIQCKIMINRNNSDLMALFTKIK